MKSTSLGSFTCAISLCFKIFFYQNSRRTGIDDHSVIFEMNGSQRGFIMFNEVRFGSKSHKTLKSSLKGNFAGKCNQISRNPFIQFILTNIKRSTFQQINKNKIIFDRNADQPLNDIRIINDCQFVLFGFFIFEFFFPIKIPFVFPGNIFQVTFC